MDLVADVFTQVDFRRNRDDPGTDEKIEKLSSNIHLVQHGAIRLFAKPDEDDWLVHGIDLNPSMLLYEAERHRLHDGDLQRALNMLKAAVTPLLAEPLDTRHIVPGIVMDEKPVAFWRLVDSETYISGINIRCLHDLSHPNTGPAGGAKKNRIQLGDKKDDCVIRIEEPKWATDGLDGTEGAEGIRVSLILKRRKLTDAFMEFATIAKVSDTPRLVSFTEAGLDRVYRSVITRLVGTHLPVPAAWLESKAKGRKDCVTHAKAMALASRLTSVPLEEIRIMDAEVRQPSGSTLKRLKKDLPIEAGRLAPVPVATLFDPPEYAGHLSGVPDPAGDTDPTIANVYGER